jgi:phage portal protein BeeE
MSLFDSFLGRDADRPPAPEDASPEDVQRYTQEFLQRNHIEADSGRSPPSDVSPFAKADETDDSTKHKADFPWLADPSRGVRWDFDPIELRNLGQTNTWVGMLVQSITKEVAETSWTIVEADGRAETQKRLNTHPEERVAKRDGTELPDDTARQIHDLLMRPNPDDTWQDLVEMWLADLLEVGSTATVKAFHRSAYDGDEFTGDPSAYKPRAIQPSAPEVWTKDFHDRTGILDGFWQFDDHRSPGSGSTDATARRSRGVQEPTFFDTDEMIWSDMTPRTNRRYGIPPTLLVRDFLQSLDLAITQEQQYLSRGSIPSGAWIFEEYDREQLKEQKAEMEENVKGKPHKSLMFAGRGGDVRFEAMSMNFSELEFTERMKWYARVVASAFQVPTAVVGIEPERVNYNTFQGERENFESNTLGPYLQKLERIINKDLIQPHWGHDYRFEFLPGMSESTRKMISDRVRAEFSAGIRRRNETRRELGLSEVDEEFDGFQDEVVENTSAEDAGDALGDLVASRLNKGDGVEKQTFDDYPEAAVENARMALDAREDTGNPNDCGTRVGWERANQLDNGEALSEETVRRMAAFRRHQDNAEQSDEEGRADCGWLMWNAWGGEEGIAWAERIVDDLDSEATEQSVDKSTKTALRKIEAATGADGAIKLDGTAYVKVDGEWSEKHEAEFERSFNQGSFTPEQWADEDFVGQDTNGDPVYAGDSGNGNAAVGKEALRNTDDWGAFDVQPEMVEELTADINDDVRAIFDEVLSDDEVRAIIDRLAADDEADETAKSLTDLSRRLREIFESSDIVASIRDALDDATSEAVEQALDNAAADTGEETTVDIERIREQLRDREVEFADRFADEISADIRETVGDGWADGKGTREIASDIAEQADINEGWTGAERIARQELQIATGEARSEFAREIDKVEIWNTSGDRRVRDAHDAMDGTWKWPSDDWEVDYTAEGRGVEKESVPGDSEPGIGCRCGVLLRDRDEVDRSDYAGDGTPST